MDVALYSKVLVFVALGVSAYVVRVGRPDWFGTVTKQAPKLISNVTR